MSVMTPEEERPFIHIHAPQPDAEWCAIHRCPTCERERRFYCTHTPWYGVDRWCTGCGDMWQDGELSERPFERGWRRRNREYARRKLALLGVQA